MYFESVIFLVEHASNDVCCWVYSLTYTKVTKICCCLSCILLEDRQWHFDTIRIHYKSVVSMQKLYIVVRFWHRHISLQFCNNFSSLKKLKEYKINTGDLIFHSPIPEHPISLPGIPCPNVGKYLPHQTQNTDYKKQYK